MALFTIAELYNDEDTINHHGFQRKVTTGSQKNTAVMPSMTFNVYKTAKVLGNGNIHSK